MNRRYIWTEERFSVLKEMAREGKSQNQMAIVFGVSQTFIQESLEKFNIQTRRKLALAKVLMFTPESPANLERWAKCFPGSAVDGEKHQEELTA